jgi:hypothetical protein
MNAYPLGLVTADLLSHAAGAIVMLVIVTFIACPLVWSRDKERRARSREALRMLIWLLTGHGPNDLR